MIIIKTIRYFFEAILGLIFLIITKSLGLNLSRNIMSFVISFIGPKLRITSKAKENLSIAFPKITNERKNKIILMTVTSL